MRRLIAMALAMVGLMAAEAYAQTGAECAGATGGVVGIWGNYLGLEGWADTNKWHTCPGRARVEVWLAGQQGGLHSSWVYCTDTGRGMPTKVSNTCVLEGGSGPGIYYIAKAGIKTVIVVRGFIGWWDAYSKHWYIDQAWYPAPNWSNYQKRAGIFIPDPGENSNCTPQDDGDFDGIPGEPEDCPASPIVISLQKDGDIRLTSATRGVSFDLNNDGVPEQTAWTAPRSRVAFLAYDRNGNGTIDNGGELFGDHTIEGASNGYFALGKTIEQESGTVDGTLDTEPLLGKLLLWEDKNHNGYSEADELQPATNVLKAIGLGAIYSDRSDRHGNLFKWQGWATLKDGTTISTWDVFFTWEDGLDDGQRSTKREQRRQERHARHLAKLAELSARR